jgi:hypothetical protein
MSSKDEVRHLFERFQAKVKELTSLILSNTEVVRGLRHDLDEVVNRTEDISRRLDEIEARHEGRAAFVEPPRVSEPPAFVSTSPETRAEVRRKEEATLPAQQPEGPKSKTEALRNAARQGDIALAKRCIEEGADVNEVIHSESVLDEAIEAGQLDMVRLLVANGAKIEHGIFGRSQIRRARYLEHNDIANFLEREITGKPEAPSTEPVSLPPVKAPTTVPAMPPAAPVQHRGAPPAALGQHGGAQRDIWTMLAEGPIGRNVRERIEEIRSRTREIGWEAQLGTYWLPRVAVLCITIAVVFFLTLAIERWGAQWMPHLRVGIGYAVCAGLLALAWRSEAKYSGLARVLYGGGFAVMYFVTFATHYVRFAQVFVSPVPTLLLLAAVVAAWTIAAQVRQSKIIAVLVTALGHLTVLLSTLTLDKPGTFAMMGLVFLSAGSAFFLLRNRWYYVASLGLVGSYVNDVVALAHSRGGNPYTDFAGSMGVLAIFFLIFALAELFSPEELRRKTIPGWFRNGFVTVNTAAFLALGTVVMSHFDFTRDHQDIFRFSFAALLMLIGLGYLRLRADDPLFNVYFIKSVALATVALATRYGGNSLSACLAVETAVLLVSARRSGLVVMRLMAFGVACVAFFQSLGVAFQMAFGVDLWSTLDPARLHLTPIGYMAPQYLEHLVRAVLAAVAFLVASQLYQRTDWTVRSPKSAPFDPDTLALCWQLDLIAERPVLAKSTEKPFEGLLFPYLYALAGAVLFLAYAFPLVQDGHRFAVMAGFALVLTVSAALLGSKPFGLGAMGSLVLAASVIGSRELLHLKAIDLPVAIAGLVAAGAVALASEESRLGKRIGLAFHQHVVSPYLLYGVWAWLTGLFLIKEFPGVNGAFALAPAGVAAAGLFLVLHPTAFAAISGGFALWASVVFLPEVLDHLRVDPIRFGVAACVLVVLSLLADRYFSFLRKRTVIAPHLCAGLVVNAIIVLLCYFEVSIQREWLMTATALACYGFLAYAAVFSSPAATAVAFAATIYASMRTVEITFDAATADTGLAAASILLVALSLLGDRYFSYLRKRAEIAPYLCAALVINAIVVLLCYFEVSIQREWLMTATALACYGFLAYAAVFRSPAATAVAFAATIYASMRTAEITFDAATADPGLAVASILLVALSLLGDRYFAYLKKRATIAQYACAALVVNAIVVLLCYFEVSIQQEWLMTATALACYGFLAYAAVFRSPAAAGVAFAGMLYASCRHTGEAFNAALLQPGLVVAFVLLAVFWVLSERLYVWLAPRYGEILDAVARNSAYDPRQPESVLAPIGLATVLLLVLLDRIPHLTNTYPAVITISWFGLAAVLFVLSLPFRQRFYRYAGLGVIVLSLARLFLIDMKEQDPLLRVAAFAVVGAGLLCISIGYYKWMARARAEVRQNADEGPTSGPNDSE